MIKTAGDYIARAIKVELGETTNGDPQVIATFRVSEGPEAGQEVMWFGFLFGKDAEKAEKNQRRTLESLRYMGFQGDDLDTLEQQILDNEVQIVVEMKPGYKDPSKEYPSVRFVNRIGGGFAARPVDTTKRKRLSAELKGMLKGIQAEAPAPAVTNGAAPAGPVSGSTDPKNRIPF